MNSFSSLSERVVVFLFGMILDALVWLFDGMLKDLLGRIFLNDEEFLFKGCSEAN